MPDKKLYNIYGKKQLKERINKESFNRMTCSFYHYCPIKDPESVRNLLYEDLDQIKVLGRVYISGEGINAQISIPEIFWNDFLLLNKKYNFLKDIMIKKALQEGESFLKLKILIKKEIVA